MAKRVELDISRCCACGACSIACMDQNDIDLKTGVFRCSRMSDLPREST